MTNSLAYPRIRADKEAVARLFGISSNQLIEKTPHFGGHGWSTIAIRCHHPRQINMDVGLSFGLPDYTVWPEILMDEHGTFYGFANACICGKVYYIEPTIELLELAESITNQNRAQLTD